MIVVDAGAFFELLARSAPGLRVEAAMAAADRVYAPHLLDAEVLHRLVQSRKHGLMGPAEVQAGIEDLRDAPIVRIDHRPLLEVAARFSAALSGYDALYVALADVLACPLLTTDGRLARTARARMGVSATDVGTSGRQ